MAIDQTDQGPQHVLKGAEQITQREMLERRMLSKAKPKAAQKSFQSTELFGGLPPHQDILL